MYGRRFQPFPLNYLKLGITPPNIIVVMSFYI